MNETFQKSEDDVIKYIPVVAHPKPHRNCVCPRLLQSIKSKVNRSEDIHEKLTSPLQ